MYSYEIFITMYMYKIYLLLKKSSKFTKTEKKNIEQKNC